MILRHTRHETPVSGGDDSDARRVRHQLPAAEPGQ